MTDTITVEMMSGDMIHWRCLHGGPLTRDSIDQWDPASTMPWARYRARNILLLTRLTETYGACAVLAREGDRIVGQLRFYPKDLGRFGCKGGFCLQQDAPAGPGDGLLSAELPPPDQIEDKTLVVNCMMTGSPSQKDEPVFAPGAGARGLSASLSSGPPGAVGRPLRPPPMQTCRSSMGSRVRRAGRFGKSSDFAWPACAVNRSWRRTRRSCDRCATRRPRRASM